MEEGRRNLLVGVFVLLGLGALGTLIVLFGRGPTWLLRGRTYPLNVQFSQVTGIRPGTLVIAKGITIGRVQEVGLVPAGAPPATGPAGAGQILVGRDAGVNVVLAIKQEYLIPEGSQAQTTEPMLGQGRPPIEIIPGPVSERTLSPGATLRGDVRRALDAIFPEEVSSTFQTAARQIGDAAEALTPVLDEVKDLIEKRAPQAVDLPGGPQGNLSSAVARLDSSFKHFNEVLGDPATKSHLREAVANVREISERGKKVVADLELATGDARQVMTDAREFVAKADSTLTNLDARITDLARATTGTLDRADTFLDSLNIVGRQISSGEGNLGRLVMDGKLYEAMLLTAERLSMAVEEFRALVAEWREGKVRVAL